ncbi:MAG: hypothetical protein HY097_10150 [Nitrospinae bacterium]|nr:hypothetical protein [Nitrospinota bacterium]MBI3813257.1 hypothetical protein [Nitrospinota bacterium]
MKHLLIISAITFFLISGCIPSSDNPLTEPILGNPGNELIGSWFWKDTDETGFLHIGKDQKKEFLNITMVAFKKDGEVEATEFIGHTSKLSSNNYLNLKWVKPENFIKGYLFIKYRVSGDKLEYSIIDSQAIIKGIKSGDLKGEVISKGKTDDIKIHEEQEKLREYVLKNDADLFKGEGVMLKRLQF